MGQNSIWIDLNVKDNGSKVINNLQGTIRGAVIQASSLVGVFTSLVGSVGNVGAMFDQAMNIQADNIATSGDLMKIMGLSYDEATSYIDNFSNKMSEVAAALPGETANYVSFGKAITDNLAIAFTDATGALDIDPMTDALNSITESGGFRAVNAGVTSSAAGRAVSKFIGGGSIAEVGALDFFENNQAVIFTVEKELEQMGKDLEDLTSRERVELLQKALEVPDEIIQAANTSVSGMIEGFKSSLFDPQTGIFGMFRDLDDSIEGNQTLLDTIGNTISLIVGDSGIFSAMGAVFDKFGIKPGDPLVLVRSGRLNFHVHYSISQVFFVSFIRNYSEMAIFT